MSNVVCRSVSLKLILTNSKGLLDRKNQRCYSVDNLMFGRFPYVFDKNFGVDVGIDFLLSLLKPKKENQH